MFSKIIIPSIVFAVWFACLGSVVADVMETEPTADLGRWVVEQMPGGTVKVVDSMLEIKDQSGCTIWYQTKLTAPIEIEYHVTVVSNGGPTDRVSDVNCFWMADESRVGGEDSLTIPRKRSGKFSDYDTLLTYYVGMGGNGNTTTRFRRYDGTSARPLLSEHDLRGAEVLLTPNASYRIRLVARGGRAEFWRDGKRIFSFKDPKPLRSGWFGIRTVNSHLRISRFRVKSLAGGLDQR